MSSRLRAQPSDVDNGESAGHAPAAVLAVAPAELPPAWLAKIFEAACRLPLEEGPEAVASAMVSLASELMPKHAFAVSLPSRSAHEDGGIRVVLRNCVAPEANGAAPSNSSLFAEYPYSRTLTLDAESQGVTVHAASGDANSLVDGGPVDLLMRRLGELLTSGLRYAGLVNAKGRESLELRGQIIQSEKLASLGQLAAGVVHELNNPLTSIIGYSDYLRTKAERAHADPEDVERLRRIGEAAGRIMRFSSDLVAYARPSIEQPAPLAMHAVIDQAFVFCEHVLRAANVQVVRAFANDLRPVLGVRDQLTQVFVNLFTNACHAMEPSGGTLAVSTALDGARRCVKVVVSDTGHGIDPETAKRIFEPFFTTKTEGRGTGLGLSIVHNIIVLHRGTIAVENTSRSGTRFALSIPLALAP